MLVRYILLVIVLLNCHFSVMSQCEYNYSKTITINSDKVSGSSNLKDYPLLINITDAKLKTLANGGRIQHANGYDIKFMSLDCSCWLEHQIEKYDATTGELVVWVKIPDLSYDENTQIEMYYGNPSISSDLSTTNVWDNNFVSRYHLNQDPSGTSTDYTTNTNDGNLGGGGMDASDLVAGKIGNGLDFDGDDYLDLGSNNLVGTNFTMSLWLLSNTATGSNHGILGSSASKNLRSPTMFVNNNTKIRAGFGTGSSWNVFNTPLDAITDNSGTWHHVAYTYDGVDHVVYVDGEVSVTNNDLGLSSYNAPIQYIGRAQNAYFIGKLDEVSMSNVVRSSDWIKTEFNNQNAPGTFYSIGSEKEAACSGPGGVDVADGTGGLVLWLKGGCGLKDADGNSPDDGEAIKDWIDQSGTGNNYYQSSVSERPTYDVTAVNDQPGIYMTGLQFLNGPDVTYNEATVFFVINAIDYGTRSRLFNNASYSLRYEQWYNTGTFGYTTYGIADYNSGVTTPYGEWIILSFTKKASESSYTIKKILDGVVVSSGAMNVGSTTAPVPLYELGYLTQGYIPEIIIYNRVLDTNEEGLVQDYLTGKYGVQSPRITGTTGPGGIGDTLGTDALKLWLKADTKVTYDGYNNVSSWENIVDIPELDISASGGSRPTMVSSSGNFNSNAAISFNGSNQLTTASTLSTDYFPTDAVTTFIVSYADNNTQQSTIYGTYPLALDRLSAHIPWSSNYYYDIGTCCGSTARINGGFSWASSTNIWGYTANPTNGKYVYRNGTAINSVAGADAYSGHGSHQFQMGSGYSGDIAEMIMYNQRLNDAERVIVENYLGEKYNISMGVDYYAGHTGAYVHEIQGIGTADGTLDNAHIQSKNSGGLEISMLNNSFNAANEFAFVGYKETTNAIVADDVPPGIDKRWKRAWYVDVTGTIDLEFNFNLQASDIGGFPAGSDYVLLYSPTNAFSFVDWTALYGINPVVSTSNVRFSVPSSNLTDGYFTIATINGGSSPLPIELISFKAKTEESKKVKLNWSTATEFNNDYFVIQRSPTGYNWEEIQKIDGAGTSLSIKTYETIDPNPHAGTSYYRLKQIDYDGKYSFSPIVSVVIEDEGEIVVYPNPAGKNIFISKTNGSKVIGEISLYNQIGQKQEVPVVLQNGVSSIDVSQLMNGIYFVEVYATNTVARYKIIVSH